MGTCGTKGASRTDQTTVAINDDIKKEQETQEPVKILLLGAGESGKSTFAKQIKIIHCGGFTEPELYLFKEVIVDNVATAFYSLIEAIETKDAKLFLNKLTKPNREIFTNFQSIKQTFVVDEKLAKEITLLLSDPGLTPEDFINLEFHDSSLYFLQNVTRIANPKYSPSNEDVLRCRAKTSGIQELKFKTSDNNNIPLSIVDVGGQRSERRKWVNCFSGITAIIFFVSLSEYDQTLEEESETNRMCESLKVFDEICNFQCLSTVPIILFFNKKDLFEQKIIRKNINIAFPEYTGESTFDAASNYIKELFLDRNHNTSRPMFHFFTFVADTEQMKKTISAVTDIVIETKLRNNR